MSVWFRCIASSRSEAPSAVFALTSAPASMRIRTNAGWSLQIAS